MVDSHPYSECVAAQPEDDWQFETLLAPSESVLAGFLNAIGAGNYLLVDWHWGNDGYQHHRVQINAKGRAKIKFMSVPCLGRA